ncbi:GspE/PulE family protein [Patescibacteria group bacterium]|nr:GspE/PulE family protein [Patescibacteria group bacterium]MBU4023108.1 GspE/PulE family protein [Patescibacteria group bacterium]MBU4078352.1 GspE/PulE family protein [Patescibacteria group bacterium]
MNIDPIKLKKFLLDAGFISARQFKASEKKAKNSEKPIEDILLLEKLIAEDDLVRLKAYIAGIPFINLDNLTVGHEVLEIIPEAIASSHNIVAFKKDKTSLEVAMLDPEDLQTIDFIKRKSNLKILPRLTTESGVKNLLAQYRKTLKAEFKDFIKKEANGIESIGSTGKSKTKKESLENVAKKIPVIRIVDTLLKHAAMDRASDIHIEPSEREIVVRYRVDGILRDAMTLPKQVASGIVARIKVLANLKLDENRLPQDGRFRFKKDEEKFSVRVSILPVIDGEKVVMRLLAEGAKGYGLEELGLSSDALEGVIRAIKRPTGMILITGPTGSGKTTTLYSILELLNTPEVNICTVEDPVEYHIPRVNQTQVNPKIGLTFSNGLRSLLRQDPDIIMVGEIRDKETASLAVNASLTGHLVLSTLHTNSAAGAIPRLIDMKVEPFLIASTLNLIIAQRLVRRLCDKKEEYELKDADIKNLSHFCSQERLLKALRQEKLLKSGQVLEKAMFYKAKKSKSSVDGYKGRVGIYEVLPITETIKGLITEEVFTSRIEDRAKKDGMRTMIEDGLIKAAQGITTIEEVLRVTRE